MHTARHILAHGIFLVFRVEHHDNAAGEIFAQKTARRAAHDYYGLVLSVLLHMHSRAVAHVALYENSAAAHGVTGGVAAPSADVYFAAVHGVARSVLRAAFHPEHSALHVRARAVAYRSHGGDVLFVQTAGDKTLSVHAADNYFIVFATSDYFVELSALYSLSVYFHITLPRA